MVLAPTECATWAAALATACGEMQGEVEIRRFPDEESQVGIRSDVAGRDATVVWCLDRPDPKLFPLALLAAALRDAGAMRVGLVAPYLAYMRQDAHFAPGDTIAARHLARFIEERFDWLVTVDPHLHRFATLGELYKTPARAARAAPAVVEWIRNHVATPVNHRPRSEKRAVGIAEVAGCLQVPSLILDKKRLGDRDVRVIADDMAAMNGRRPVIVDDIVSTARTVAAAARLIVDEGGLPPLCVVVHA